jgi:hypothetical protein
MTLSYEQGLIEAHRMIPSFYSFNERGEIVFPRPSVEPKGTDSNEEKG